MLKNEKIDSPITISFGNSHPSMMWRSVDRETQKREEVHESSALGADDDDYDEIDR